jgi:hypothetical protein
MVATMHVQLNCGTRITEEPCEWVVFVHGRKIEATWLESVQAARVGCNKEENFAWEVRRSSPRQKIPQKAVQAHARTDVSNGTEGSKALCSTHRSASLAGAQRGRQDEAGQAHLTPSTMRLRCELSGHGALSFVCHALTPARLLRAAAPDVEPRQSATKAHSTALSAGKMSFRGTCT